MVKDRIEADGSGFAFWHGKQIVAKAAWDEVEKVVAFKRDLLTEDVICFALSLSDGTQAEANEDVPGWAEFVSAAEYALSGLRPQSEWHPVVAFPAFATNETVLFTRQ